MAKSKEPLKIVHIVPNKYIKTKQNERKEKTRSAIVVYALTVMEELNIKPSPPIMEKCIRIGLIVHEWYDFDKHGPYANYMQEHLKKTIDDDAYEVKILSKEFFD